MIKVTGVRFRQAGKVYYFDPKNLKLERGSHVIVETARGIEYGTVIVPPKDITDDEVVQPLKAVIRVATPEDDRIEEKNHEKEKDAYKICLEKIEKHGLAMKLVQAEYTFDNNKLLFYFTADGRIDFRELVKDLASVFKTRIELRQIGVRDRETNGAGEAVTRALDGQIILAAEVGADRVNAKQPSQVDVPLADVHEGATGTMKYDYLTKRDHAVDGGDVGELPVPRREVSGRVWHDADYDGTLNHAATANELETANKPLEGAGDGSDDPAADIPTTDQGYAGKRVILKQWYYKNGQWVLNPNFGNDGYTVAENKVTYKTETVGDGADAEEVQVVDTVDDPAYADGLTTIIPNATYLDGVGVYLLTDHDEFETVTGDGGTTTQQQIKVAGDYLFDRLPARSKYL